MSNLPKLINKAMLNNQQLLGVSLVKNLHMAHKCKTNFQFFRVSLTCACSMHLALFPLDEQTCYLNIASCEHLRHLCDHLNNYHLHHLVIYVIIFVIINPTNFPAVFFGIFHGTRLVE